MKDNCNAEHHATLLAFARSFARTSGDSPDCRCISCLAHRVVQAEPCDCDGHALGMPDMCDRDPSNWDDEVSHE